MANKRMEDETISKAIEVYDAIVWYMESEERAPVVRELMVMVGMGCSATVQIYLNLLRDWGWITSQRFTGRTIQLTRPTEAAVIRPRKAGKRRVA